MDFSKEELERYSRHLAIPEFGIEAQFQLKKSSVLVIGAGGLGSPLLYYLAAAGVGKIGIVEFDSIDLSNLQRQILYDSNDLGQSKVIKAAEKVQLINPHVKVEIHETRLNNENARAIIRQYDIVADGTDNFATRYLVNDACVLENKPNVYASVLRFEGQVSVFNFQFPDLTRGPNYRDLFPTPPPPGLVPSCAEGGVLGVLPGIIGSIQASEVIKVLTHIGDPLVGRLFIFDALSFSSRILNFKKNKEISIDELQDYEALCGNLSLSDIKEIAPIEAKNLIEANKGNVQLIDVREKWEHEIDHLGEINIPVGQIEEHRGQFSSNKIIILYCKSGIRSAKAAKYLSEIRPELDILSLSGGIDQWRSEINE